jgi:hypothetical protein
MTGRPARKLTDLSQPLKVPTLTALVKAEVTRELNRYYPNGSAGQRHTVDAEGTAPDTELGKPVSYYFAKTELTKKLLKWYLRAELGEGVLWPHANFTGATLKEDVSFAKENLFAANFADFNSKKKGKAVTANDYKVDFTGCELTGANFKNACLKGAKFDKAILYGADFTGADVTGVDFKNALFVKDAKGLTGSGGAEITRAFWSDTIAESVHSLQTMFSLRKD